MTSDLERAFADATSRVPTWCATCGGPRTDLPMLIELGEGEHIGKCPDCDGATCPDGRSARKWTSEGENRVPLVWYPHKEAKRDAEPVD